MNKKEQRLIIAENLRILLKQNNKKRTDVASDLKISYSTVSDWARGRTSPNAGQVKMLADYFKVPISAVSGDYTEKKTEQTDNMVAIEIIGTHKNSSTQTLQTITLGHQLMPISMLREFTNAAPTDIKIIRIENESMKPTINAGDMVWVDTSVSHPDNDGIYLLNLGNMIVPKRILINPIKHSAIIKSDNPEYENFTTDDYNQVKVFGKVIYHIQKVV